MTSFLGTAASSWRTCPPPPPPTPPPPHLMPRNPPPPPLPPPWWWLQWVWPPSPPQRQPQCTQRRARNKKIKLKKTFFICSTSGNFRWNNLERFFLFPSTYTCCMDAQRRQIIRAWHSKKHLSCMSERERKVFLWHWRFVSPLIFAKIIPLLFSWTFSLLLYLGILVACTKRCCWFQLTPRTNPNSVDQKPPPQQRHQHEEDSSVVRSGSPGPGSPVGASRIRGFSAASLDLDQAHVQVHLQGQPAGAPNSLKLAHNWNNLK